MAKSSSVTMRNGSEDSNVWADLRDAIANSSGFQGWKREQDDRILETQSLDKLVRRYLRETLETLAY